MGLRVPADFACANAVRALQYSIAMRECDVGKHTALYVPEPIEPECTQIITRHRNDDPTTIFEIEEARAELPTQRANGRQSPSVRIVEAPRANGDELPTVCAKGSVQVAMPVARVAVTRVAVVRKPVPPPIPPRRRAVTPVSLDVSYEAAMRLFR